MWATTIIAAIFQSPFPALIPTALLQSYFPVKLDSLLSPKHLFLQSYFQPAKYYVSSSSIMILTILVSPLKGHFFQVPAPLHITYSPHDT